jgi:hypothetical protein
MGFGPFLEFLLQSCVPSMILLHHGIGIIACCVQDEYMEPWQKVQPYLMAIGGSEEDQIAGSFELPRRIASLGTGKVPSEYYTRRQRRRSD